MAARLLPLELIDKCIGSRLWIIMKGDKVSNHNQISSNIVDSLIFVILLWIGRDRLQGKDLQ